MWRPGGQTISFPTLQIRYYVLSQVLKLKVDKITILTQLSRNNYWSAWLTVTFIFGSKTFCIWFALSFFHDCLSLKKYFKEFLSLEIKSIKYTKNLYKNSSIYTNKCWANKWKKKLFIDLERKSMTWRNSVSH